MEPGPQTEFVPKRFILSVWGMDAEGRAFIQGMQAVNISPKAVEFDSPRKLRVTEIVGAGVNGMKSRFRIVSVRLFTKDTYRIVMEDLGSTCMWEKELASPDVIVDTKQERRRHKRWPVRGSVDVHNAGRTASSEARLVDISQGGCYIETLAPAPSGSALEITMNCEGIAVAAAVSVCTSHPSIGMGVEIKNFITPDDEARFTQLLATVESGLND